jgi:uncharacterized membrane protein
MRVDPQDREDAGFLLRQAPMDANGLSRLLERARVPEIPEIREAFEQNARWLQSLLGSAGA